MGISLEDYGLRYIVECFKRYQNGGCFLLLFFIALCCIALTRTDWVKKVFIPYVLVLFATAYNILIMQFVIKALDLSDEYYRFLWLLPVALVIAYSSTWLIFRLKAGTVWKKVLAAMVLSVIIILSGKGMLTNQWSFIENIYKIPDEIIEISQMIHGDSAQESPKAAVEFDVSTMINQYDPSIRLAVPYGESSQMQFYEEEKMEFDLPPYEQSKLRIYQVITENNPLDNLEFANCLKLSSVDYVVSARADGMEAYILTQNCELIGRTENYDIYRFIYFE